MEIVNPTVLNVNNEKSYRKPYNYQQEAINQLENSLIIQNKKAGILQIPTGGGKTYTAVYWLFNSLIHKGYKIVWIAHRIDLLQQALITMTEESYLLKGLSKNPKAIIVGGGYSQGTVIATAKEDILLLSFQTIAKNRGEKALMSYCKKNKKNKVIFVIDEAHHSVASSYKVFIERDIQPHSNFKLLGLTATPTIGRMSTASGTGMVRCLNCL
jgi:superfamily II DNA or RNA helicase